MLLVNVDIRCAMKAALIILLLLNFHGGNHAQQVHQKTSPWKYTCVGGKCEKSAIVENDSEPQSLAVCQLFCGSSGPLWPMPTGHVSMGNNVVHLNYRDIQVSGVSRQSKVGKLLRRNVDKLIQDLSNTQAQAGNVSLLINFRIEETEDPPLVQLTLDTNENYTLNLRMQENDLVHVTIFANNYFGARHGIETLSQLIVHDELYNEVKMIQEAHIIDGPAFVYRGILLDTSRNFIDKKTILRTIEAMGMSKLNTLHWHITDSHSFPYVSRTWPLLSKYGAYSSRKVYTPQDIQEILEFALLNGVRVLPEFDAPAHVGEGWQWVGDDTTVCFKAEPWRSYCVEPPCGQLNPTKDKVYEILEGIYEDMISDFQPDIFHMGGDEVHVGCWNSVPSIKDWMIRKGWNTTNSDFYKLWSYFQEEAYNRLTKANDGKEMTAILWTSELTSAENLQYLNPNKYIVQIWTTFHDSTIERLLTNNFRVIFSNYDALYFDCGYASWVGMEDGNNWCSPYIGWQKVYQNSPRKVLQDLHKRNITNVKGSQILGSEATLWSEQVEGPAVDTKLWPRAAAMAERMWSDPDFTWHLAENRFLWHRERLARKGIIADAQKPEWCIQNQGACY